MIAFPYSSVSPSTLSSFFSALSIHDEAQIDSATKEIMRELFHGSVRKRQLLYTLGPATTSPHIFENENACIPDKMVIELLRSFLDKDTAHFTSISAEIAEEFDINDYPDIAELIYSVIFC